MIVDYIWGAATEALLATLNNHDLSSYAGGRGIRLVNVGSMAGPDIRLPAAVLRSNQLQIMGSGTGNFPPIAEMQRYASEILAWRRQARSPSRRRSMACPRLPPSGI